MRDVVFTSSVHTDRGPSDRRPTSCQITRRDVSPPESHRLTSGFQLTLLPPVVLEVLLISQRSLCKRLPSAGLCVRLKLRKSCGTHSDIDEILRDFHAQCRKSCTQSWMLTRCTLCKVMNQYILDRYGLIETY